MGHKTHPTGFRTGVNKSHNAIWFANYGAYSEVLKEDYKIRPLPDDLKKRKKRLEDLGIYCHIHSTKEYVNHNIYDCSICKKEEKLYTIKSLPAHIQLAEKMIDRGVNVEVGSRLEYLVTMGDGHLAKQYNKLEDPKYQNTNNDILKIDVFKAVEEIYTNNKNLEIEFIYHQAIFRYKERY